MLGSPNPRLWETSPLAFRIRDVTVFGGRVFSWCCWVRGFGFRVFLEFMSALEAYLHCN